MVGGFHLAERRLPLVEVQYTVLFIRAEGLIPRRLRRNKGY